MITPELIQFLTTHSLKQYLLDNDDIVICPKCN